MERALTEVVVGRLEDIEDPGCREFEIGDGDWPFKGFVVRRGNDVFAYQNYCMHVGHPLNWMPDAFLTKDRQAIICASDAWSSKSSSNSRCSGARSCRMTRRKPPTLPMKS